MQNSTSLPDLRMLPTSSLVPHEDCDPRRVETLSRRVLEEGILKNPPIVTAVPDTDLFVVLDGANRTMAFSTVGAPHIVAQVVSYDDPGVYLDTWYHVVSGLEPGSFENALKASPNMVLEPCDLCEARNSLVEGAALAYFINAKEVRMVLPSAHSQVSTLDALHEIVSIYRGKADIFRASNDIWEIQTPYYPQISALVVFPRLNPEDILNSARNGEKIPSGITRHIIPTRALNINIPIGILMADWDQGRKDAWLRGWLLERMAANAIRFYAESTFSFNE